MPARLPRTAVGVEWSHLKTKRESMFTGGRDGRVGIFKPLESSLLHNELQMLDMELYGFGVYPNGFWFGLIVIILCSESSVVKWNIYFVLIHVASM